MTQNKQILGSFCVSFSQAHLPDVSKVWLLITNVTVVSKVWLLITNVTVVVAIFANFAHAEMELLNIDRHTLKPKIKPHSPEYPCLQYFNEIPLLEF